MEINLDLLLQNYNSELVNKLRGFNDEVDYLQFWVPSSNKKKSLFNLIDAINETKVKDFSILISKKDKNLINEIKNVSHSIGKISIKLKKHNYKIDISIDKLKYSLPKNEVIEVKKKKIRKKNKKVFQLNDEKENYNILKEYKIKLKTSKLNFMKKSEEYKEVFSDTIDNENKLFVKIDDKTKKISDCWHNYESKNTNPIVVDKFCNVIIGKTIQEASEHGTIYLEHLMRPGNINQKIKGIILPKKVGGIFFDLHKCINQIYSKIKKQYNFQDTINKEYFDLSNEWVNLSKEKKFNRLNKVLLEKIIPTLKLKNNDIIINEIESDTKIIIKISQNFLELNSGKKNYLIMAEDIFKQLVDGRLEFFTIEKKDDNTLRHVNSPQKI